MRKLAWTSAGFALAALAAEYILPIKGLPFIAAGLLVILFIYLPIGFFLRKHCGFPLRRVLIPLIAFICGLLYWWGYYEIHVQPCEALTGRTVSIEGRVIDYPAEYEDCIRLIVHITDGAPTEKAVLYYYTDEDETLPDFQPGDTISTTVKFRSVRTRGDETIHTYTAQNRNLCGNVKSSISVEDTRQHSWLYFPQRVCRAVKDIIVDIFPEDTVPFVTALLTGDTTDLYNDAELYGQMRISGVLHIVAVSGLHVSAMVGFLYLFVGKNKWTSVLVIPALIFFMFMAGCRASIVRAVVMNSFIIVAPLLKRKNDGLTSLMAALLLLLLINPLAIGGVGLQLSFACIAGFVFFGCRMTSVINDKTENQILGKTLSSLASTLCASVFSLPISFVNFGTISLISPLANLLTLPVVTVCFSAAYACCIIGIIFRTFAVILAQIISWPIRYCFLIYKFCAAIPNAAVPANMYTAVWLAVSYAVFLIWFIPVVRKCFGVIFPTLTSVLFLLIVLNIPAKNNSELTVIDTNNGQCAVLTSNGHAIVVNCGGYTDSYGDDAGDAAADCLNSMNIRKVDALFVTDSNKEFLGDAADTLSQCLCSSFAYISSADISKPQQYQFHDILVSLYPLTEDNIIVRAATDSSVVYFMGDAGKEDILYALSQGYLGDADYLILDASLVDCCCADLFLGTVKPETVIITVSNSYYSDLSDDTVQNYYDGACKEFYRTDTSGTVTYSLEGR